MGRGVWTRCEGGGGGEELEEGGMKGGTGRKGTNRMDWLEESMRVPYVESVNESLKKFDFNFVLSDPRLADNPIVYASEGFCKMTGYTREEVLGRNCRFLQGKDTDRRTVLEIRDALREERSCQVKILNYDKQGKTFWNLFHLAPVYSKKNGTVIHYLGVQTPISDDLVAPLPDHAQNCGSVSMKFGCSCDRPLNYGTRNVVSWEQQSSDWHSTASTCARVTLSNRADKRVCACEKDQSRLDETKTPGMLELEIIKLQDIDKLRATTAVRSVLCELIACSRGKEGVQEQTFKHFPESTAQGVVCSSLMLSLTRIQQSFVLVDPSLSDMPVVHASDLFLHLTGYGREEVVGQNCRFMQGPGTDRVSVAQIRDSIKLECPCSVRLLNYRKDKRPFWNLLHIAPVRSSAGKVAFFVGVQLEVSSADEHEVPGKGITPHMKQMSAVGAVRVAVRSLQGSGLRRTWKGIGIQQDFV